MANVADYNVANASGASVRSDINNIFQAVVTLNSGTSEPSTMYPFMIWVDTTNNVVKMRNGANDGWLTMPFAMNASNSVDINAGTIDGVSLGATSAITSAVISGDLTVDTSTLKVDSSNNRVGIGASPAFHVDIQKSLSETYSASTRPTALTRIYNTNTADNNHATLEFGTEPTSGNGGVAYIGSTVTGSNLADLFFGTRTGASTFATHMTIKSDGKTGIGTTSPDWNLQVESGSNTVIAITSGTTSNAQIRFGDSGDDNIGMINYDNSSDSLAFTTNALERMRLTSGGNLTVGATTASHKIEAHSGAVASKYDGTNHVAIRGLSGGQYIQYSSSTALSFVAIDTYPNSGASTKAQIATNGDFYTNDGTVSSLSDERIKTNVIDLSDGLEIVNQLRPITYEYNNEFESHADLGAKDGVTRYGFVAQEVEAIAPQYVNQSKGKINGESVDDLRSLSQTKMIPMLVKSIQEQQEQIEELKQQINELRGN